MNNRARGAVGERIAYEYLRKKKYKIAAVNYHSRYGEIDIIAWDERYIIFVEVKLREFGGIIPARDYVNTKKQKRIQNTAEMWLAGRRTKLQPRFDVIEIYVETKNDRIVEINHLENAF